MTTGVATTTALAETGGGTDIGGERRRMLGPGASTARRGAARDTTTGIIGTGGGTEGSVWKNRALDVPHLVNCGKSNVVVGIISSPMHARLCRTREKVTQGDNNSGMEKSHLRRILGCGWLSLPTQVRCGCRLSPLCCGGKIAMVTEGLCGVGAGRVLPKHLFCQGELNDYSLRSSFIALKAPLKGWNFSKCFNSTQHYDGSAF